MAKPSQSQHELENEKISAAIQQIYTEHSDKGHRRIRDDLEKDYGILTSNKLVFDTFDKAVQENPNAHPMLTVTAGTSTPAESSTRNCWTLV